MIWIKVQETSNFFVKLHSHAKQQRHSSIKLQTGVSLSLILSLKWSGAFVQILTYSVHVLWSTFRKLQSYKRQCKTFRNQTLFLSSTVHSFWMTLCVNSPTKTTNCVQSFCLCVVGTIDSITICLYQQGSQTIWKNSLDAILAVCVCVNFELTVISCRMLIMIQLERLSTQLNKPLHSMS